MRLRFWFIFFRLYKNPYVVALWKAVGIGVFHKRQFIHHRGTIPILKYMWYKYVRRLDIVGFYMGVPVVRTKHLTTEPPDKPSEV